MKNVELLGPAVLLILLAIGFGWWVFAKAIIGELPFRRGRRRIELAPRPSDIVSLPPRRALREGKKLGRAIDA